VRRETLSAVSLRFDIPAALHDDFRFQSGQFLNVRAVIDGEEVRRSYSLCSTPHSGEWRIAVKKEPGGKFSAYANDVLVAGDTLELMPPDGRFVLHPDDGDGLFVFFAAGSGITPVLSLVTTILQTRPQSRVVLFYGNRTVDSIIFREALDALKNLFLDRFELHHILSAEQQEAPLFNGRIDADKCTAFARVFFDPAAVRRFFLCGPEQMIFTVRDSLLALGVDDRRISYELFTTPGSMEHARIKLTHVPMVDPQKTCHVTIRLDGDTTEFSLAYGGQSILDAAAAAGRDVPYSCKGGVCCTCKAMLLEGEVDMDVVYGLEPDEVEDGFILTCQAHPRSETVLVDYDIR
jgi:ring-1,2-phenylacetyl-CoA epoxidase subunit PaaE